MRKGGSQRTPMGDKNRRLFDRQCVPDGGGGVFLFLLSLYERFGNKFAGGVDERAGIAYNGAEKRERGKLDAGKETANRMDHLRSAADCAHRLPFLRGAARHAFHPAWGKQRVRGMPSGGCKPAIAAAGGADPACAGAFPASRAWAGSRGCAPACPAPCAHVDCVKGETIGLNSKGPA